MTAKFYAIKGAVFDTQASYFGPFYSAGDPLKPVNTNGTAYLRKPLAGLSAAVRAGRYGKWPGVYSPPQPARAWFTVAAPGGITNHSTFTLDDGVNPLAVFEFDKGGGVTPGNIQVDITTAVTASDVAVAVNAAINNYTQNTLGNIVGGWFANTPTGKPTNFVLLLQTGTADPVSAQRVGFTARTYGALGNTTITVGAGSGLTAVHNFAGGTRGASGVLAQFVNPGNLWVVAEGGYVAVPKGARS